MFLAFGLLVFPSQLGDVLVEGTLLGLIVACVARPLATAARHGVRAATRRPRRH